MYEIELKNKISPAGLDRLDSHKYKTGEGFANPDAIMVRSASLHDAEIPASVKAIARAGAGVNNIPIDRCTEAGIAVFNTPGANANAVKELVITGLLLSSRKIIPGIEWVQTLKGTTDVAKQVEAGKNKFVGPELKGKTLGVIGLGAIGVMVCNTARHFGMEILGYDPYLSVEQAWKLSRGVKRAASLKEIYEASDYITIHIPATPDTKGMINSQSISSMKHGVRILNFSRAELVDNADILEAIAEKQVRCYITDFPSEELLGVNGVIAIPHLGASTPESEDNCAHMAALVLKEFLENGNITNSVNLPNVNMARTGKARITIIHRNIPTMLSQISAVISQEHLNIENLTNKSRDKYAYTVIDLEVRPSGLTAKLSAIDGVIRVTEFK